MTHRFHRKQNRLLLLRLSNKNKVRKSTGAHRQQVTRRHLHQSPCGRPAGSGCAPPLPSLLTPASFLGPRGWGRLAVPTQPGQSPPSLPFWDRTVPSTPAANCSLPPSAPRPADTSARRRGQPRRRLSPTRTWGQARCRSSSFPDQATGGFPARRPAFQTLASALGTPASRAAHTSGRCALSHHQPPLPPPGHGWAPQRSDLGPLPSSRSPLSLENVIIYELMTLINIRLSPIWPNARGHLRQRPRDTLDEHADRGTHRPPARGALCSSTRLIR